MCLVSPCLAPGCDGVEIWSFAEDARFFQEDLRRGLEAAKRDMMGVIECEQGGKRVELVEGLWREEG
jgi:hypothetical protein